jgi:alkanesulfonate monooxygenase SsuD/methylene tetrahydromethanopterin reductase-like flavin-dependent oxidoreductase (luciferase family)
MLGGSGKGILRRAARWADILHMTPAIGGHGTTTLPAVAAFDDDAVATKLRFVREEAAKHGRKPHAIRYATTIYNYSPTSTPRQTREIAEQIAPVFGMDPAAFVRHPVVLAGTPEEMADEIHRRAEVHALEIVAVNFSSSEQIRAFADGVIAKVKR